MDRRITQLLVLAAVACSLALTPLGSGATSSRQTVREAAARPTVRGPRGPRGHRGFRGPRGFRGLRGPQGIPGPRGPQGEEGLEGADGPMGFTGPRGPQGATGPQGAAGNGLGRPGYASSTVDASGGYLGAAAIGADGLGLITYDGGRALNVAHCSNLACSASTKSTIDTCTTCQLYTSVAIGADGLGLISYSSFSVEGLHVAHCSDTACTSATLSTLGAPDNAAFETTSVAIGTDGLGVIGFLEPKGLVPKVAHCENLECTQATISVLDPQGDTFRDGISVAIGTDGLPLVSYQTFGLKVAHCDDVACTTATTATLDTGDRGDWSSLAIGQDGLGLISYFDRDTGSLKVAHCSNVVCSSATTNPLDTGDLGGFTSLTIGSDGLGVITYEAPQTNEGPLKVAHCSNIACSTATVVTLDPDGNLFGSANTLGVDGLPLVAYHNDTTGVKAVHCSNVFCVPYFRRR